MLNEDLKAQIQTAYSRFLQAKGFKPRYGQRLMIAEAAKVLGAIEQDEQGTRISEDTVVAIEAGTGVGKTVAYSLALIPVAKAAAKRLVIATATVALQEQILYRDLPDVQKNSGLAFSFAIAKGRRRYLCVARLANLLSEGKEHGKTAELFAEEGFSIELDSSALALYSRLQSQLDSGAWDGDRDRLSEPLADDDWLRLSVDHHQCAKRRCAYIQHCPFYQAREAAEKVDVIVTNHDLVLADLALGGGLVLPAPDESLYVFDEGHHLADKAISHFAHKSRLRATENWLAQSEKTLAKLLAQNPSQGENARALMAMSEAARTLRSEQQGVLRLCEQLAEFDGSAQPCQRFAGGKIPEPLREAGLALSKGFAAFSTQLEGFAERLKNVLDGESRVGISRAQAELWYPLFGSLLARATENLALWQAFCAEDKAGEPPMARWLALVEVDDIEVNASPILAAATLRHHLWQRAYGVLLCSATLTALGRFDRLRTRAGLPQNSHCQIVPSPFDYAKAGLLRVPDLKADPSDTAAHSAAISAALPELLAETKGSLVLFSSRRQMQEVFEALPVDFAERILRQGVQSKQKTLEQHRERIEKGQNSILFGLASFAEGIDLPGVLCEQVVIAKIPFAVPDEPIEATLAEWIKASGGNPFMQISVPDASLKLIQACGRLIRSENDSGTITVLDRRLLTRPYGKAILESLPPFRRELG